MDERLVAGLARQDGGFEATMADGSTIVSEKVLAAPGIRHFANLPAWCDAVPHARRAHTSELVSFENFSGARVVVSHPGCEVADVAVGDRDVTLGLTDGQALPADLVAVTDGFPDLSRGSRRRWPAST